MNHRQRASMSNNTSMYIRRIVLIPYVLVLFILGYLSAFASFLKKTITNRNESTVTLMKPDIFSFGSIIEEESVPFTLAIIEKQTAKKAAQKKAAEAIRFTNFPEDSNSTPIRSLVRSYSKCDLTTKSPVHRRFKSITRIESVPTAASFVRAH